LPFCTNCGAPVDPSAAFCHNCGAPQPRHGQGFTDFLDGLSDRTACVLCYVPVFGIIAAIVFLASHKYRRNPRVRFNAFQALYLFVAWLIVSAAAPTLFAGFPGWGFDHFVIELVKLVLFICWIYLLVKAVQQEDVRLPIIGDLAARSTSEQL
jgi:uncharacterized membrane protein